MIFLAELAFKSDRLLVSWILQIVAFFVYVILNERYAKVSGIDLSKKVEQMNLL